MAPLRLEELSDGEFEALGRQLVAQSQEWSSPPSALGQSGADEGYDSRATDVDGNVWMIQFKKWQRLSPKNARHRRRASTNE